MRIKRLLIAVGIVLLLASGAYASKVTLPLDASGVTQIQVFAPTEILTVAAAGDIDVTDYRAVMFSASLDIFIDGDTGNVYPLPANTPLGTVHFTTIHVSAATKVLVME